MHDAPYLSEIGRQMMPFLVGERNDTVYGRMAFKERCDIGVEHIMDFCMRVSGLDGVAEHGCHHGIAQLAKPDYQHFFYFHSYIWLGKGWVSGFYLNTRVS